MEQKLERKIAISPENFDLFTKILSQFQRDNYYVHNSQLLVPFKDKGLYYQADLSELFGDKTVSFNLSINKSQIKSLNAIIEYDDINVEKSNSVCRFITGKDRVDVGLANTSANIPFKALKKSKNLASTKIINGKKFRNKFNSKDAISIHVRDNQIVKFSNSNGVHESVDVVHSEDFDLTFQSKMLNKIAFHSANLRICSNAIKNSNCIVLHVVYEFATNFHIHMFEKLTADHKAA